MAKKTDDFSFKFAQNPADSALQTAELAPGDMPEPELESTPKDERNPFKILILGDFSGRTNRGICQPENLAARSVRTVDSDNFAEIMGATKPEIRLPVGENAAISLGFSTLDDFRPDALLQKIPAFTSLLSLRHQLLDTKTFPQAATLLRTLFPKNAPPERKLESFGSKLEKNGGELGKIGRDSASFEHDLEANGKSDLERLLERDANVKKESESPADALFANVVSGYAVPAADPDQSALVALVEDALSAGLRAVLRHPAFQAVEGAWRAVEFLTSRLDLDSDLKICLLDVSKEELLADLTAKELGETALHRILVERTRVPGAAAYALVVADYEFDQGEANVVLLAKLGAVMCEARVPVVAGAGAKLFGWESFAAVPEGKWEAPADMGLWERLRGAAVAGHIGLAAPRFLLRLPYGPKTDAIETFKFQEIREESISGGVPLEQYVWGNGAFAVALLYGQAFLEGGWEGMEVGNDVADLPCHMRVVDGDREMVPCAQGYLSERVGDILREVGVMPVLSVKNAAAVKVAGVQSIARGKGLAGWWAS